MSISIQQIFDKVAWHLLAQGRKSVDRGACAYRGDNGDKCAVGCLIPNELYRRQEMEGRSVTSWQVMNVLREVGVLTQFSKAETPSLWLLRDLQIMHDRTEPEFWRNELGLLAAKHHLRFTPAPPLPFPSDEAELAERNARYDAITAINKAAAVERKTLTTAE